MTSDNPSQYGSEELQAKIVAKALEKSTFDVENIPEPQKGHFQSNLKYTPTEMVQWGRTCLQEGQRPFIEEAGATSANLEEIFEIYGDGVMEFHEVNDMAMAELFETSSAEFEINGQKYLFELKVRKV